MARSVDSAAANWRKTLMYGHPDEETIARARSELAARDPVMARLDAKIAPFVWRSRASGFAQLAAMITEQQVSVASARAIWARLEAGLGEVTPAAVLARDADQLRGLGLSRQKARYLHAIAEAEIDFSALATLPEDEAVGLLTGITGVGRWTAEIYLMMSEGRPDAFPAGDLALQAAMLAAEGLTGARPSEQALRARAEPWRPWRGVAAHLLWAFYLTLPRPKAGSA